MSLKASTRQMGTVTVIDLSGKIVLGDGSSLLRETVKDLASRGQKKLLLNLADVSYIDSSGLGALVASFTTIKGQEGQIKLLNLTSKVHDLLQITKLLTVFTSVYIHLPTASPHTQSACSSVGQSNGLLIRRSEVRILPGAPVI